MLGVLQWFIGLGSTVFLPIVIIIIALLFGVKLSKAVMAGITVGIGNIGLGLVIDLLSSNTLISILCLPFNKSSTNTSVAE